MISSAAAAGLFPVTMHCAQAAVTCRPATDDDQTRFGGNEQLVLAGFTVRGVRGVATISHAGPAAGALIEVFDPSTNPASTRGAGREPPGRNQSTKTIHSDTVATSSAAIPEGMIFSAQLTVPLPHRSNRTPVTIVVRHCLRVGFSPLMRRNIG